METITQLKYVDHKVLVAGLSNEQFSSAFRRMAFPFTNAKETTTLQIYHVSHKRSETQAPVMTFTPTKCPASPGTRATIPTDGKTSLNLPRPLAPRFSP